MIPDSPPFQINEKVYCFDHFTQRYYEGSIRKMRLQEQQWNFLVHYSGWNSRWDQWRPADDLNTIDNQDIQQIIKMQEMEDQKAKATVASTTGSTTNVNTTTNSSTVPAPKTFSIPIRPEYSDACEIPITLKIVLANEAELIRLGRLHNIPSKVTIEKVLQQASSSSNNHEEFTHRIIDIFQLALPKCLLYPQEVLQFQTIQQENHNTQYAQIYPPEFLLRLYTRLPLLLVNDDIDTQALKDLLIFMQKKKHACFKLR